MKDVLISVIVPAYNIAPYIEKSIASICAQTHQNLEIIIVDDGSKDDTLSVLQRLAKQDERIRVIAKENGGVTSARLRGAAEATGEWIGFVDGDDYIEPQMYERLLSNALEYQADISHCGYQMVFPKGHVDYYYDTGKIEKHECTQALVELIRGEYVEPGLWNKLFRKCLFCHLLEEKIMDSSIRINEDLLMNYYLFHEAKTSVYEDICPYHYLLRTSSAMMAAYSEHKLKDPMKVTRILLEATNKDAPEVHAAVQQKYIRQLIGYAAMDCTNQLAEVEDYRREMRKELRRQIAGILQSRKYPPKLKIMALWAGIWPESYGMIHRIHAKIKGNDRIYDLDK